MKNITIKIGNFFFRWRDTTFTLIFAASFLGIFYFPEQRVGDFSVEIVATTVGFFILALGQFIRALTIGLAYIKRGGLNKTIYAETLVKRGMFAHCRNPLYLGNILIVTGAVFIINMPIFYAIVLPLFYYIYLAITLAEEEFLGKKFGIDYQEYLKTVNRFIPGNLSKWKNSTKEMDFTWKRLIKKEHGTFVILFASTSLLSILKFYKRYEVEPDSYFSIALWVFIGLLVIFQIISAILKRRGALEWDPNRP